MAFLNRYVSKRKKKKRKKRQQNNPRGTSIPSRHLEFIIGGKSLFRVVSVIVTRKC